MSDTAWIVVGVGVAALSWFVLRPMAAGFGSLGTAAGDIGSTASDVVSDVWDAIDGPVSTVGEIAEDVLSMGESVTDAVSSFFTNLF